MLFSDGRILKLIHKYQIIKQDMSEIHKELLESDSIKLDRFKELYTQLSPKSIAQLLRKIKLANLLDKVEELNPYRINGFTDTDLDYLIYNNQELKLNTCKSCGKITHAKSRSEYNDYCDAQCYYDYMINTNQFSIKDQILYSRDLSLSKLTQLLQDPKFESRELSRTDFTNVFKKIPELNTLLEQGYLQDDISYSLAYDLPLGLRCKSCNNIVHRSDSYPYCSVECKTKQEEKDLYDYIHGDESLPHLRLILDKELTLESIRSIFPKIDPVYFSRSFNKVTLLEIFNRIPELRKTLNEGMTEKDIKTILYNELPLELPRCKCCGKPVHAYNLYWFSAGCSDECSLTIRLHNTEESNLKKYGVTTTLLLPEVQEQIKATNVERYGVECALSSDECREKATLTMKARYGADHPLRSDIIRNKLKATNLERYGNEWAIASDEIVDKIRSTNLERYGNEWAIASDEVISRINSTNKERYGNEWAIASDEVRSKIKCTNLERYGVESPFESVDIREKIKATLFDRYGVINPLQSLSIKESLRKTCIEKYGYDNVFKSPIVQAQIRSTNLERYGNEWAIASDKIRDKIKTTNLERYGAESPFESSILREDMRESKLDASYKNLFNLEYIEPLFTRSEWEGHGTYNEYKWKCKECGRMLVGYINGWRIPICRDCHPITYHEKSNLQIQIAKFIKDELGQSDLIECDRNIIAPKELDIVIPSKKLAIEVNGDYWHQSEFVGEEYHLEKTEMCEKLGYHLIHIFEHEWYSNTKVIKNRIVNLLGLGKVYYARKCEVKEVSSSDSMKFQQEHHTQGGVGAAVKLGLYFNDELVALMTFGAPRFNHSYEYELIRYCSSGRVQGGASKLLKHFELMFHPKSIVSYADRRWSSSGNLYKKLGFTLVEVVGPSYFYVNQYTGEIYSRYQCMKFKLPGILGSRFKPELTELENMMNSGFVKVSDCGNYAFSKIYSD